MTEAGPSQQHHHPGPPHPSSSLYASPHSRHPPASASTALHPHAHHRARSTARQRFGPALALAEEEDGTEPGGPSSFDAAARARADKARLYDRAFAQSALLASSSVSGPAAGVGRRPDATSRRGTRHPAAGGAGGIIDEESALDGDAFVAPTEAQPFGLPRSDHEEDDELHGAGGGGGAEVERMRRRGLGGIMSEMMSRQ